MTGGTAWAREVVAAGGGAEVARESGTALDRHYAEPHRSYHTGAHVLAVLRDSAELADALWLAEAERCALALAVCAHDVVYDASPGDDERASADWAQQHLQAAGVRDGLIHRVRHLVLATLTHEAPAHDRAAAALLDADLAILASEPAQYARYVEAVRAEYANFDEATWRRGRSAVLLSLANRPRIYVTDPGRERWEQRARHNLSTELARLNGVP